MADDQPVIPNLAPGQPQDVNVGQAQQVTPVLDSATVQQAQQPSTRPPAPRPILMDLFNAFGIGGKNQTNAMGRPVSRLDHFENFLGNFVQSLGAGFGNEGKGPGAAYRGAGAAMQAPYQQSLQNYQLGQQAQASQSELAFRQAQTAKLQEEQTRKVRTDPNDPNKFVGFMTDSEYTAALRSGMFKPPAAAKRYINIPGKGLIDTQASGGPAIIEETKPSSVTVTPDMAQQFGLPSALVGQDLDLNSLAKLENAGPKSTLTTQLTKNPITGVMELSGTTQKVTGQAGVVSPRSNVAPPRSGFPRPGSAGSSQPPQSDVRAELAAKVPALAGGQTGVPSPGGVNTQYLNSLPQTSRGLVQAIGEGRTELTPSMMRSKHGQDLAAAVTQAYPGFDQSRSQSYVATRKDFTAGKTSQGINAFNTALAHLERMFDHTSAIATLPGVSNVARLFGNKSAAALNTEKIAVATELAKAYGAGQLTEGEMREWKSRLDVASPLELRNNETELAHLLQGKLTAYQNQWQNGMPPGAVAPISIMSSAGMAAYRKITETQAQSGGQSQTVQPALSPAAQALLAKHSQ